MVFLSRIHISSLADGRMCLIIKLEYEAHPALGQAAYVDA
jgi:hypothetical protein